MSTAIPREQIEALKAQAMMAEKGARRFTVRLGATGGHLGAEQLLAIAAQAKRFGDGSVHLTTRQGLEIPHVPFENLGPLRTAMEEAGLPLAPAGKCVRSITACPGSYCLHGLVDTQGLAQRLHARIGARKGLPHKFKVAIAGCLNGCTEPKENDLGILGRKGAFTVFVGGKMGKQPRWADALSLDIRDEERLFAVVEAVIDWFAAEGQTRERFGATIDRVGINALIEHLCRPEAGRPPSLHWPFAVPP
jgi:dissimilatory sulfite reductase (desulfoviridin) alpha/beta subunit